MSDLGIIWDLLSHRGFLTGLAAGFGTLVALYLASLALRRRIAGWAVGVSLAVLWALIELYEVDPENVVALAAVAIAGLSVDLTTTLRTGALRLGVQIVAGALLLISIVAFAGIAYQPGMRWVAVTLPVVALVVGGGVYASGRGQVGDLIGALLAVSVLGIWVTIPETDMMTVAVGASLSLAPATVPPVRAKTSVGGSFALACLLTWLTVTGGETVPLTIFGGWAAMGMIPLVGAFAVLDRSLSSKPVVFGLHVAAVVIITRVVDWWTSITLALVVVAILNVVATFIFLGWPSREERPTATT